ncbi:hypothetical protein HMPREF1551_01187 [Capnocytophaga sp. oral taxon 863 str. F0517]|uniref:hypothetical protein n=1 Tax=Capnocytophaga sp. oral taxon 863 TaxID=1227265 RepID=UPI000397A267|nr:hypothetical protein [Capnocytophaga sp. oral taxon 863]ERI63510.1 hypothetical protein HMPREF1551_01187 [Capnocytophaga sp. oral taxon 863 str. F0517]
MPATLTRPKKATKEKQLEVFPLEELNNHIKKLVEESVLKNNSVSNSITTDNDMRCLVSIKFKEDGSLVVVGTEVIKEKAPAKAKAKAGLAKPEPRVYNEQQKEFRKMLLKGLKEMKAIRAGKMKAGNLDDLLNEL